MGLLVALLVTLVAALFDDHFDRWIAVFKKNLKKAEGKAPFELVSCEQENVKLLWELLIEARGYLLVLWGLVILGMIP